jgi:hypothetical protein
MSTAKKTTHQPHGDSIDRTAERLAERARDQAELLVYRVSDTLRIDGPDRVAAVAELGRIVNRLERVTARLTALRGG